MHPVVPSAAAVQAIDVPAPITAAVPLVTVTPPEDVRFPVGRSPATSARKAGVAAPPEVALAQTLFAVWVASVPVSVPAPVMGLPLTEKIPGKDKATLVTVPAPDGAAQLE